MIKARPITGTPEAQESLMNMLGSFVYRRYTDFSVIAALREMKSMMRAEVTRLGMDNDLKRGAGGIREIEFIAQSLQLIHGGRIPEIRTRPLLSTLAALERAAVLSTDQLAGWLCSMVLSVASSMRYRPCRINKPSRCRANRCRGHSWHSCRDCGLGDAAGASR